LAISIEVGFKPRLRDPAGASTAGRIRSHLGLDVSEVRVSRIFTVDAALSREEALAAATELFCDPVVQDWRLSAPYGGGDLELAGYDWSLEVGFRPGVTDNEGRTAREALAYLLGRDVGGVYTSTRYLLRGGSLGEAEVERVALGLLCNPLIQHYRATPLAAAPPPNGDPYVPRVFSGHSPRVEEFDLELPAAELLRLSAERLLALDAAELLALQSYLRRPEVVAERRKVGLGGNLSDVELEVFAQTWSEHCKHKIFNAAVRYEEAGRPPEVIDSLFDTFIRGATERVRSELGSRDYCLSVFRDNAGVVRWIEGWNLVFKVETHNSPSALDPYGGALTGIVGVNRDPFGTGLGCRLIFNTDTFCFAPPEFAGELPPRLLHPRRIYEGVREGVEHGGNKSGIPTVNGSIIFDERYLGKPLVYCGTGGLAPAEVAGRPSHLKQARPGDAIVMCGGRIGKDGIHGATFSSEELHEGSPATAVQIGDPITQKRMTDFLLLARDRGLYSSITDNGAGGLSSSVGEMARESGGCELHLERAPLKYAGLDPWEILLSEAQERMTVAVPQEKLPEFMTLARRMQVESTELGRFTESGRFHVLYEGRTVASLELDFLHNGLPRKELVARWRPPEHAEPRLREPADLGAELEALLSRLNVCSKESVIRRYDHEVQGGSVVKPLVGAAEDGPSDAAVLRPLLDSMAGVVVSSGICPRYGDIDTYAMAACAIDEAVRNAVAVGADPDHLCGIDNFCWPDPELSEKTPDGDYKLAQLVRSCRALYEVCVAYRLPCISGKDSMKNDYLIGGRRISIPPTLLFSVAGRIAEAGRAQTMDFKEPGDAVYVLGLTRPELGGSEYFLAHGAVGNRVPQVDAQANRRLYLALHQAIGRGLVRSCHDLSDGGLGVAAAESAFAGGLGCEIDLRLVPREGVERDDFLLFSESQGRFLVSVTPEDAPELERQLAGCTWAPVGEVRPAATLRVLGLSGRAVVEADIFRLKEAWQRPLRQA
jgi:phosphoribosylformylglycinamidine synthase II